MPKAEPKPETSTPAVIELQQLQFAWPARERRAAPRLVLNIPSLRIEAGETVFLHGPSGCGKSTLLGLLAGVLAPSLGRVSVLGKAWASLSGPERDRFRADHIGYIFQQFNLLPFLSAIDNALLPCRFSSLRLQRVRQNAGKEREHASELLHRVGLPKAAWTQPAGALSVGQQQRVAAVRAMIGWPELLIADEPTSALDAARRDQFVELLLQAPSQPQPEGGQTRPTVVFVSHDERLQGHFSRSLSLPAINEAHRLESRWQESLA